MDELQLMHTEIEAKLKVDSLPQVESTLAELGAEFLGEQLHRDCYFDDGNSSFKSSDRALRLRRQTTADSEKNLLTYKGPKAQGNFKRRQEIEIEVGDFAVAEQLLSMLGYKKALVFEKNRRLWRLGDCVVALDHLPLLGDFVEIEGPDNEKISHTQKRLGLANLHHVADSYAQMIEQRLHQLGQEKKQVLL
jgi:adenylate cyclase class 2